MSATQQEIEFRALLSRNNEAINSICLRFCGGNVFYFDELRQECVLALWAEFGRYGLSRFRGDSAESTWVYQISFHAAIHYLRNPNHRELLSVVNAEEVFCSIDREDWEMFDNLREHLDSQELNMLDHYLRDDSYSAIADKEGITESGARKRMSRLIKKMRALILKNNR